MNEVKPQNVTLPVIVEDEMIVFPFIFTPIFISDKSNIAAAQKAQETGDNVFVVCAKNNAKDNETPFYDVGVIGKIMRKVSLPDGKLRILFQGISKGKINNITNLDPVEAEISVITYKKYDPHIIQALLAVFIEKVNALSHLTQNITPDLLLNIENTDDPNKAVDLVAPILRLKKEQSYTLFSNDDTEERLMLATQMVSEEIETQKLQKDIRSKVHTKMDQINREFFLKEQLKQIQKELGIDKQRDEEIEQYYKKLEELKPGMHEDAYKEIKKQIDRLSRSHPDSSDANMVQNYVEWVLEIPFTSTSSKALSIKNVEKQLNKDHYSLLEPKGRIVEYFAVKQLLEQRMRYDQKIESQDLTKVKNQPTNNITNNEDLHRTPLQHNNSNKNGNKIQDKHKGTILCFYGPPGVGKTSLANSIALALGRPLVRIALGGLEDVNELRGHRRTYLGSMPGRIIQGLIDSKKMNPVMVLDEIDKLVRGVRGDPTSVLLEILDPEQNISFRDYYTNFNVDLSQVIFIATANDISLIPAPLRDRMEFIEITSYTPQEKYEIARKYLIPQEIANHGLQPHEIKFSKESIETIIHNYTREAGVRNLRRRIAQIMRKIAVKILNQETKSVNIGVKNLQEYLKKTIFEIDKAEYSPRIGVVNGLAWTAVGGDVLKVEALSLLGKGNLKLTGQLGDVMKESAYIAYSVVKSRLDNVMQEKAFKEAPFTLSKKKVSKTNNDSNDKKDTTQETLYASPTDNLDIHLHVPEGATPKDGPSAGITIACAIASVLFNKQARQDVAMTGELNLSGEVLPIGGLKEKLIAAYKANIQKALIPTKNYKRDLEDIPLEVQQNIEIIAVKNIDEVFKHVLIEK